MKVLVSACLMGKNCKYNGGNNHSGKVAAFLRDKEVIEVCPEILAGFSIPRTPMEIVDGILTDRDGNVLEEAMQTAIEKILKDLPEIDCAVLKSRSPSCGVRQVYDGNFSGTLVDGQGKFARALMDAGYTVYDSEELP